MVGRGCAALVVLLVLTSCTQDDRGSAAPRPSAAAPSAAPAVEASPAAPGTSVAVADRTLSRISLTGGPDYLAASGGLVWVKHDDGRLLGLDPATGEVRRTVQVAANPGAPGSSCQGLGGDAEHLWTCSGPGVARVAPDATSAEPVAGISKIADQTRLPVQNDRVWVLDPDGTTVHGLAVGGGSDRVRLSIDVRCTDAAAGVAPYLWLVCPGEGTGARLDTVSGELVRVPGLRGISSVAVADDVFFGYRSGIARVDQDTAEVTGAVAVTGATGLHAAPDALWVRGGQAFLRKVDPGSLAVLEEIAAPETSAGSVLLAHDVLWATAPDDAVLYRLRPSG